MPTIRSIACLLVFASAASAQQTPSQRLNTVADQYLAAIYRNSPITATMTGYAGARHDLLNDNSLVELKRQDGEEDAMLASLETIKSATLTKRQDAVTYGLLIEALRSSKQTRVCRRELVPSSWVPAMSQLATIQPMGSDSLRRAALARFGRVPGYLDTEIANARQGITLGYSLPKDAVQREIARVEGILALPQEKSPFMSPAVRDTTSAFRASYDSLFRTQLTPAFQRYRDFLVSEYLPAARAAVSVSANPNGAACYRALIRRYTTIDRDPRALHQLGLARMEKVHAEMRALAQKSFGTTDLPVLFQRLRSDTQYTFHSREEIVQQANASIARARVEMPKWFGIIPKADVVVEPFPMFLERGAPPGQYQSAPDDGSRPGTYRVNTFQPEQRSRGDMEDVTFHEAIPGHHLQISIARERTGVHPVTRNLGNSGFSEGWGLYSERLADEMGLYSSDLGRLGALNGEAFRAARLVVDAGIHAMGWTRQQSIDYFMANSSAAPEQIASEIDRYIATPGQATAYMLGAIEIRRLRTEAEKKLGTRFDIRTFHDKVLEDGGVTLPMLDAKITTWIRGNAP
ncbi:MAG: putative secreted protein [Gemmatimonadetes bacterium]|nr:putative secreted protein [Gemmatimonadota bacterium]